MFGTENLWTYFHERYSRGDILTLEELYNMAVILWNNYSNPGAFTKFVVGRQPDDSPVPIGEPWREAEDPEPRPVPKQAAENSAESKEQGVSTKDEGNKETKDEDTMPVEGKEFLGDHTLARSAAFMHEALVSKEVAQAVAEGDVGRVYEGIKVSIAPSSNFGPVSITYHR